MSEIYIAYLNDLAACTSMSDVYIVEMNYKALMEEK